jgi:F-type H+-transporting ATPase subunit a
MGLEFLARVRKTSVVVGAVVALLAGTYRSPAEGLGFAVGLAWSLVNLRLLEVLIVTLTGPGRGEVPALRRAALAIAGTLGLFAVGALLLAVLPPMSLVAGFTFPLAVIVLKAASMMLLGSKLWRRFAQRPRRTAGLLLALGLAAWAAWPLMAGAEKPPVHGTAVADSVHESVVPGGVAETHGEAVGAHGEAGHGEAGHGESNEPQKFANFITVLARAFPHAGWAHFLHEFESVVFALFVAVLMSLVAFLASRKATLIPGRLQNLVEMLVEALYNFVVGILGEKHGPRYVPFLGTQFLYILCMNLFGLIPFMDSPTSSLNITVAMAVTVFFYAQYIGFKELGFVGYFDHLAGNPRTAIQWMLVPIMVPIHILGEFAKPISLAARLFGNVFGEDMLLVAFATIGVSTLAATGLPFGLPLQLPFLFLALLTGTLQALVFTVLSTIYFLLMLPHDEHEHEGEAQHAHP